MDAVSATTKLRDIHSHSFSEDPADYDCISCSIVQASNQPDGTRQGLLVGFGARESPVRRPQRSHVIMLGVRPRTWKLGIPLSENGNLGKGVTRGGCRHRVRRLST
jgi:hypothetical protein